GHASRFRLPGAARRLGTVAGLVAVPDVLRELDVPIAPDRDVVMADGGHWVVEVRAVVHGVDAPGDRVGTGPGFAARVAVGVVVASTALIDRVLAEQLVVPGRVE